MEDKCLCNKCRFLLGRVAADRDTRKTNHQCSAKNITEETNTINYLVSDELLSVHDISRWKIQSTHTEILKKEMEEM